MQEFTIKWREKFTYSQVIDDEGYEEPEQSTRNYYGRDITIKHKGIIPPGIVNFKIS